VQKWQIWIWGKHIVGWHSSNANELASQHD